MTGICYDVPHFLFLKAGKAIEIMRYLRAKSLSTLSSEGCHREQISQISNI